VQNAEGSNEIASITVHQIPRGFHPESNKHKATDCVAYSAPGLFQWSGGVQWLHSPAILCNDYL
jgi:hypothetical protein